MVIPQTYLPNCPKKYSILLYIFNKKYIIYLYIILFIFKVLWDIGINIVIYSNVLI